MNSAVLALAVAAVLACLGCKDDKGPEVPPPSSFTCQSAADCRVSSVERGDCCGDPCKADNAFHEDELAQVQAANRKSCPETSECPHVTCPAPTSRFVPVCKSGRCGVEEVPMPN